MTIYSSGFIISVINSYYFYRNKVIELKLDLHNEHIFDGDFGLERETLRVSADGKLAQTDHPFADDKYLDRDFCENQLELITPVCRSAGELIATLGELDAKARNALLRHDEYLWIYSNPPHFDTEDDIPIARYSADRAFKHDYRVNLERRYGKRLMLYSGIHLNLSFSEKWLKSICEGDYEEFKNKLYFRLFKQATRYSWLLVLLTAASPVYDKSLDADGLSGDGFDGYGSRRSGSKGYWNQFVPVLDYTDIHAYAESVKTYIDKGALFSASELYVPIRLKPRGLNSLDALLENGANHIELRMFDVNPLSKLGIFREDIEFAYYFMLYLLSRDDFDFTPEMQRAATEKHKSAALYEVDKSITDEAVEILDDMAGYFKDFDFVMENIALQREKLIENKRYCVKVYEKYNENYQAKMLSTARGDDVNV